MTLTPSLRCLSFSYPICHLLCMHVTLTITIGLSFSGFDAGSSLSIFYKYPCFLRKHFLSKYPDSNLVEYMGLFLTNFINKTDKIAVTNVDITISSRQWVPLVSAKCDQHQHCLSLSDILRMNSVTSV